MAHSTDTAATVKLGGLASLLSGARPEHAALLQGVLDSLSEAVLIISPDGGVTTLNRAATDLVRYVRVETDWEPVARVLRGEPVHDADVHVPMVALSMTGQPLRDSAGRIIGALLTIRHELLDAVLNSAPAAIAIIDSVAMTFLSATRLYSNYMPEPYRSRGLTGARLEDCIPGFNESGLGRRILEVADSGKPFTRDAEYSGFERGSTHWRYSLNWLPRHGDRRPVLLMALEITDQVTARKEAEANVRQLEAVLHGVSEGLAIADPHGRIVHVNNAAARILGYDNTAEMGKDLVSLGENFTISRLDGTPVADADRALERALRGHRFSNLELRLRRRDTGLERIVSYSASPIRDECGAVMLGVVVLRDVTAQKRAEADRLEALEREQQARAEAEAAQRWYRQLADSVPQIIYTANADGYIDYANRHWFEYSGLPLDQTQGDGWQSALHPDDISHFTISWKRCLATGEPFETEYRFRRASDGCYRWHLGRALPLRDAAGRIVKWFGTCTDIHGKKEAEARLADTLKALTRSELRFRRIVDCNLLGICFWRADGSITECNDEYLRLLGFTRTDLEAGRVNWRRATPPDYTAADNAALAEARAKGKATPFEKEYLHSNGRRIPVLIGVAFLDESQEEGVAFALDLTDRKTAELSLKQSNEDLQQFAFVASHDLQEPLRMVSSYSQLLELRHESKLDAQAREYLGFINEGAVRMRNLIRDLLEYSRMGFRAMNPPQPTELAGVIEWVKMNLQIAIEESGASIIYGAMPCVSADQVQMVQVFQNLIGNAIKYRSTEPLRIDIRSRQEMDFWVIEIADNGVGFDQSYAEQIFGVFRRLHGREYEGTGIGLAVCKRIVERHGGRIWAASTPGSGSIFSFSLPME